jgi:hypothetical protein
MSVLRFVHFAKGDALPTLHIGAARVGDCRIRLRFQATTQ